MSFRRLYVAVSLAYHVQHYVVVIGITVVPMLIPMRRSVVNLYVAHPLSTPNLHLGIEEIRSAIAVMQSRVDNLNDTSAGHILCFQQ